MPRYLISFDDGAMDFIPEEEGPAVADAAHAVIRDAEDAGVWVLAGGVYPYDGQLIGRAHRRRPESSIPR